MIMSKVDLAIIVAAVAVGVVAANVVAFYEGIYKPIAHDTGSYAYLDTERHTDAENEAQSKLRVVDSVSEPIVEWKRIILQGNL